MLKATNPDLTIVRMHGRNAAGWSGNGQDNWRAVRYLYRYNESELREWAERLRKMEQESREILVIFNNNSGGDAADNAKQLAALLGQEVEPYPPQQMDLFDTGSGGSAESGQQPQKYRDRQ